MQQAFFRYIHVLYVNPSVHTTQQNGLTCTKFCMSSVPPPSFCRSSLASWGGHTTNLGFALLVPTDTGDSKQVRKV